MMLQPEHLPQLDPSGACTQCGLPASKHRRRNRDRRAYFQALYEARKARRPTRKGGKRAPKTKAEPTPRRIVFLDGEGYTLPDGSHRYTYLAACDADGLVAEVENAEGLSTKECLEFVLALPPEREALLVGFSLGYDRTLWLRDCPDDLLWYLHHPEERPGPHGPKACAWAGYRLNLVATKFQVGRGKVKGCKYDSTTRRTVWDVFKFFQCSYVKALRAWGVGTESEVARIEQMKAKRGAFKGITRAEKDYCQQECRLGAKLVAELLDAHEHEGLHLKTYYGPGSTAAIVLQTCHADEQAADVPPAMAPGVDAAFFGGRFECSHVGPVRGPLYSYDIASAYPYALAQLPCLCPSHGTWLHLKGKRLATMIGKRIPDVCLVSYRTDPIDWDLPWGPLPHRLSNGDIVFPVVSAGGWAWGPEMRQAMALHAGVTPLEAWLWKRNCDCAPPFRDAIVSLFTRRLAWGKAARGLVLKLALNSMYGKSAQSVGGGGKFRCMVRAGLITAITRSMLLQAVQLAPWSVVELATDSVLSCRPLELPAPLPLGTEDAAKAAGKAPLGAWEGKEFPTGVMVLRPGLRFELAEDGSEKTTAARGLGVRVLHANRAKVLSEWRKAPMTPTWVQQPALFHGAMSTVRRVTSEPGPTGESEWAYVRGPEYGRWVVPAPRMISYAPGPKRSGIAPTSDPRVIRLLPWQLPQIPEARSHGYTGGLSEESERTLRSEQPEDGLFDAL